MSDETKLPMTPVFIVFYFVLGAVAFPNPLIVGGSILMTVVVILAFEWTNNTDEYPVTERQARAITTTALILIAIGVMLA